jgi:hypothetical protein
MRGNLCKALFWKIIDLNNRTANITELILYRHSDSLLVVIRIGSDHAALNTLVKPCKLLRSDARTRGCRSANLARLTEYRGRLKQVENVPHFRSWFLVINSAYSEDLS